MSYDTIKERLKIGEGFYTRNLSRFLTAVKRETDVESCIIIRNGREIDAMSNRLLTSAGFKEDEVVELEARVASEQVDTFRGVLEDTFTIVPYSEHQVDGEFEVADCYGIHARNAALLTREINRDYVESCEAKYDGKPFFKITGIISLLTNCIGAKKLHIRAKLKPGDEDKAEELHKGIYSALSTDYS